MAARLLIKGGLSAHNPCGKTLPTFFLSQTVLPCRQVFMNSDGSLLDLWKRTNKWVVEQQEGTKGPTRTR